MEWQARSPDLNPIENLRADINKGVHTIKPISNETNWNVVQGILTSISVDMCKNLVNSMRKRSGAVIANKGHSTKY